jgi:two-component system invasion response regulator UvrY
MIRILVVDDHPAMRLGVQRIFGRDAPEITMEEAAGGPEALERVRNGSFSLVLLDLVLPGRSGFELLGEIKSLRPELPVLIFSMHTDEPFVVRALKEGAAGYITKDCPPEELIRAVRRVAVGGHYIMAELSGLLIDHLQARDDRPLHEHLSSREYEVMRLLARGAHLREIAKQLCVSDSTVSTYRTRILQKLHLENNAQLTRYTLDNGLD